jgi:RNA polymerase sigma-70 factor (ECF subfamily)
MIPAFYDQIASTAFSLAVRVAGDPRAAEEAVATAFAGWDDRAPGLDQNDAASTHALLAVRQEAFRQRQAERRRRGHSLLRDPLSTTLPEPASSDTAARLSESQQERLRLTLGALPAQTREAIELMFFEGLTEAELAARLGASPAVVREQIYAGLLTLRDAITTAP